MKKSWTSGLEEQEANEVKADYRAAARLRERMRQLLESKIREVERKGRSEDLYQSPNWHLTQADAHGQIRALEHCISLIKE